MMEQEETYIPYKERTPGELCRDMNLKAEKMNLRLDKASKWVMLVSGVALLVFVVLNWHFKWSEMNWWWWTFLGTIFTLFIGSVVLFRIISKLINDMTCAKSPQLHLQIAKRLRRCVQLRCSLVKIAFATLYVLLFFLNFFIPYEQRDKFAQAVYFLVLLVVGFWGWRERNYHVDEGFCDDLDELEYRISLGLV